MYTVCSVVEDEDIECYAEICLSKLSIVLVGDNQN